MVLGSIAGLNVSPSIRSNGSGFRSGLRSGLRVDPVDFEALRFVEEERRIDASGEPAVEVGGVVCADNEDMLGVGDPVRVVMDHGLIAVEGEAVVHVAPDGVGGDQLYVGGLVLNLAGEGAGGV